MFRSDSDNKSKSMQDFCCSYMQTFGGLRDAENTVFVGYVSYSLNCLVGVV